MPAFVNLNRLVNAFKKAGATVEVKESEKTPYFGSGWAELNGRRLEFNYQAGFPVESKRTVSIIVSRSPQTDIMTDCFCDTFFDTIKSAVKYIKGEW